MNERIRILHLEDERDFSDLVRSLLQQEGVEAEIAVAGNKAEFELAIDQGDYDVVLADYLLPDYNGLQALERVRERDPEVPFLLLSGTIGEEASIASLKSGA